MHHLLASEEAVDGLRLGTTGEEFQPEGYHARVPCGLCKNIVGRCTPFDDDEHLAHLFKYIPPAADMPKDSKKYHYWDKPRNDQKQIQKSKKLIRRHHC